MEHPTPPLLTELAHRAKERQTRILTLCDTHLTREESLLADTLLSLHQVREAFFQRNLSILPTLQIQQKQLAEEATEMATKRDRFRAALADWLGVTEQEATLRVAAESLPSPERESLLQRRDKIAEMLREIDRLSQHNATLLGYARGFFACLFSVGRSSDPSQNRYGPQGERHDNSYGPLLQAQV